MKYIEFLISASITWYTHAERLYFENSIRLPVFGCSFPMTAGSWMDSDGYSTILVLSGNILCRKRGCRSEMTKDGLVPLTRWSPISVCLVYMGVHVGGPVCSNWV